MNSCQSSSTSRKESIRFSDSVLQRNAKVMRDLRNRLNNCRNRRPDPKYNRAMCSTSSKNDRSSGNSEYRSIEGSEKETCYVSLFEVCMNYLFPTAFPLPSTIYRFKVKCNQSLSDPKKKIIGKILSPIGRCSKIPKGIFVQSPSENLVTKIYCPGAEDKYSCRSSK
ncbi:uncharacterized protein LOC111026894 [Myzus persicae]|uniref:uncharacterized protein LOC111026894 n=1 Tax=Myzus persicae TaxID=13164 RepID=UPI000B934BC3|nr:uncharacterized protein LOC111026894 [Myzus persicae]